MITLVLLAVLTALSYKTFGFEPTILALLVIIVHSKLKPIIIPVDVKSMVKETRKAK